MQILNIMSFFTSALTFVLLTFVLILFSFTDENHTAILKVMYLLEIITTLIVLFIIKVFLFMETYNPTLSFMFPHPLFIISSHHISSKEQTPDRLYCSKSLSSLIIRTFTSLGVLSLLCSSSVMVLISCFVFQATCLFCNFSSFFH